jgi:nucleoside-diphosphate-sugar epimerase
MTTSTIKQSQPWSLDDDLAFILDSTETVFKNLEGAHIFMTGGTGFIGRWLLESLRYANLHLKLNIKASILTRNIKQFEKNSPHLAHDSQFHLIEGDVINFEFDQKRYSHIIHAATDASAALNEQNPILMFDTIVEGTRHILDFAKETKPERFLYLSSGAVYGQQPFEMERVKEDWLGAPSCNDPRNAYAEGKRAAEMLCAVYGKQHKLHISIARIFALLGPYLSLDIHFAAGNFIKDAMEGKKICVKGNGKPYRSYLYASDLTVWLWHMLDRATPNQPYNVGSDESVSVEDLAKRVALTLGDVGYEILGREDLGWNLGRYVPDTSLIQKDLQLIRTVSLEDAILRTALWNGWKGH